MTRDAVADYEAAGTTFVMLIEGAQTADRQLVGDLAISLADLYSAAGRLPQTHVESADLLPDAGGSDFFAALADLRAVTTGMWHGWAVDWEYHGFRKEDVDDPEEIEVVLANDLAETYRDVKDHLAKLGLPAWRDQAIWEVQFEFWSHTSNHVMGALRYLHVYLAEHSGPEPPPGGSADQ